MDSAGRIVIPKPLRERLGFVPGEPLELVEREGRLVIETPRRPTSLVRTRDGVVASPARQLPRLTDEVVRTTLERTRR